MLNTETAGKPLQVTYNNNSKAVNHKLLLTDNMQTSC